MLEVYSPFDRTQLAELPWTTASDVGARLRCLNATYSDRTKWLSKEARIVRLERLATLITRDEHAFARQIALEGGKPLADARVEVERAKVGIKKAVAAISALVGREISMDENAASRGRLAYTYFEPRGLVLALSAFNHPLNLLIHQVVPAIAAGCPVLLKPSPATPLTALKFIELLREAGIGPEHADLVLLPNEQTEALVTDSRIAFLSFIGSSKVGWHLRSLLPRGAACALEHGGIAPVLLDETADIARLVPLIVKGGYYHAGQVCVSVQRVFAPRSIASEVAQELSLATKKLTVGDPLNEDTFVGPLIRPTEVDRVEGWVNEAVQGGASLLSGGRRLSSTLFEPTVLFNPPEQARISQEEVFGPVVAVYPTEDLDEAIGRANLQNAYFQAAFFTNRLDRALDVGRRLHGTTVLINDHTAFRVDWMPFGGHRESGLGVGGIEPAMREMSLERSLIFNTLG
jgi:acyl-CoA reductase-like NAD-dependent aldehyde dehydrogenase